MANEVTDNSAQQRFELNLDGGVAFASYGRTGDTVIITHVETPRAMRGQGIGARVVEGALRLIRADRQKVVAGCSFSRSYLDAHPEFGDIAK